MNFDSNAKAIYLQIADRICDDIVRDKYPAEGRVPSVREMAASLQVNANTVMRSYERLQQDGLIANRRGIGFFVTPDAKIKILNRRGEELIDTQLDSLFTLMMNLDISPETLSDSYRDFLKRHGKNVK